MTSVVSRRRLLERTLQAVVGGVVLSAAAPSARAAAGPAAAGKVCADLDAMDSGARSMRGSLNYAETSPDATKTCSACAFFTAGAAGCGTCQIFSGPTNPQGHCDSWSQKG
jgi:hypothetical protein